jgi:cyclase
MEQIGVGIWTNSVVAAGFPTVSAVVLTAARAFVVDTLLRPQDMRPILELLRTQADGRRVVVVNTHHHWDHVYGNAAFRGVDIVAQRACPHLITSQALSASATIPLPPPEGVPLPSITFGDRLLYSDESENVHLLHAPGHSEDSLVLYLEKARLLLGGDTVEWPLPNFAQRDGLDAGVMTLRRLKQLPVDQVVPSHGPPMGKSLIDANESYLCGVYEAVAAAKAKGVGRGELDLPAARFLGEGVELDETHTRAHRDNLIFAWDEV